MMLVLIALAAVFYPVSYAEALTMDFVSPTDADSSTITDRNWTYINASITNASAPIDTFKINWNGTNVTVYDDSLVLAMNFNNNTDDWSKYGNDGTNSGADCSDSTEGRFGSACSFNGINDQITLTNQIVTNSMVNWSAFAWVKNYQGSGVYNAIFGGYTLQISNSNNRVYSYDGGYTSSVATVPNGIWTMVGITCNTDGLRIYINKDQVWYDNTYDCSYSNANRIKYVGSYGGGYYFNGSIDEARVWNRTLSSAEINATYQAELGKYYMNQTDQNQGTYSYYAWVNDTNGNSAQTETRTIRFGPQPVEINFTSPTDDNDSTINDRNWTYINVSIANNTAPLDTFIVNWNGTNVTVYNDLIILATNFNNNTIDWSKYGNDGTNYDANCSAEVEGKFGSACSFDGANSYISFGNDSVLNAYPITISAWFKANNLDTFNPIVNKYISTSESGYQLLTDTSGRLCAWYFMNHTNNVYLNGAANCGVNVSLADDNSWHNAVFVVNSAGGYLYLDGVLGNSVAWTGTPQATITTTFLSAGYYHGGVNNYFNGSIDEVRIYNRALSSEEINASYNAELGRYYMNITGLSDGTYTYYAFANDTLGNSNITETRTITFGAGGAPDTTPPTVTLDKPANGNISTGQNNITLYCNVTDAVNINNITFWTNITGSWSANDTVDLSATTNTAYNFEVNLTDLSWDTTFVWNCQAYDNSSNEGWGSANWSFSTVSAGADTCTPSSNWIIQHNCTLTDQSDSVDNLTVQSMGSLTLIGYTNLTVKCVNVTKTTKGFAVNITPNSQINVTGCDFW